MSVSSVDIQLEIINRQCFVCQSLVEQDDFGHYFSREHTNKLFDLRKSHHFKVTDIFSLPHFEPPNLTSPPTNNGDTKVTEFQLPHTTLRLNVEILRGAAEWLKCPVTDDLPLTTDYFDQWTIQVTPPSHRTHCTTLKVSQLKTSTTTIAVSVGTTSPSSAEENTLSEDSCSIDFQPLSPNTRRPQAKIGLRIGQWLVTPFETPPDFQFLEFPDGEIVGNDAHLAPHAIRSNKLFRGWFFFEIVIFTKVVGHEPTSYHYLLPIHVSTYPLTLQVVDPTRSVLNPPPVLLATMLPDLHNAGVLKNLEEWLDFYFRVSCRSEPLGGRGYIDRKLFATRSAIDYLVSKSDETVFFIPQALCHPLPFTPSTAHLLLIRNLLLDLGSQLETDYYL